MLITQHSLFLMPQTGIEPVREYKSRRILSPVRLPVPPLRHNCFLFAVLDGEGFEPSKAVPTDLQSAPFGHSGIHPCIRFSCENLTIFLYHKIIQNARNFFYILDDILKQWQKSLVNLPKPFLQ